MPARGVDGIVLSAAYPGSCTHTDKFWQHLQDQGIWVCCRQCHLAQDPSVTVVKGAGCDGHA